jgi:hypothetical protein
MPVFKTTARIQASGELAIRDLPFAPGTLVEVLVMGSERSAAEREQEWGAHDAGGAGADDQCRRHRH